MKKQIKLFILAIALIFLFIIVFLFASSLGKGPAEINNNESSSTIKLEDWNKLHEGLFTVSGVHVCLPIKDESKPHHDLCVFGIKDGDSYYRIDSQSEDENNFVNKIKIGQKIVLSGNLIEEESEMYKTMGTIEVVGVRFIDTDEGDMESSMPDSFKADYGSFSKYSFNEYLASDYPRLESWVENGEIECQETPLELSYALRIRKRELNGKKYCIASSSEGAAGSVYTQHSYSTVVGDKVYVVNFLANYLNCGNFPEEDLVKCGKERRTLDLDILVDEEIEEVVGI